ncbi:MAG: hypothetical protein Q8O37_13055 [Sulfuricellaceae bacterium]|nr:hypothetical protein [Sulfuricellaceae bacterium]
MFDFKGLISALLRKNDDNPVGDLKSATIWVQELPQHDIHQALKEIIKALGDLNKSEDTALKERIRVILYLDEKARSLQNTLCRDYLAVINDVTAQERQYLPSIQMFWEEMAAGYQNCIRTYAKNPGGKIREQMPLVTAKAIHFQAMQAKWKLIHYLPVDANIWRRLHRLYNFAEQEKIERVPVSLYSKQEETSCTSEYLQPMMLHLANPASLLPDQIEMIDFWLDSWAKSLVIESEFRPQRQIYAVNLGDTKPARKLRRNMLGEHYRYWGFELLQVHISKIIDQLKQGEVPARLKLGEACRLPACMDLIEEVSLRWAGKVTTRKHERIQAEKTLLVTESLADIIKLLKGGKPAASSAATYRIETRRSSDMAAPTISGEPDLFQTGAQQWQVENESLSGYGVTFDRSGPGEQLRIGTLVALKPPMGQGGLCIGIVRRIQNAPPRTVNAGIQTLSQTPVLVELHPLAGEGGKARYAIYLPELARMNQGRSLLIHSQMYSAGRMIRLLAQGKDYTIRLQTAVEQHSDYVRTGFDVVAKHA